MSEQMPDRIRKLKALADDERAPQGERDAARHKLKAALDAAGITEDQIGSETEICWPSWALDKPEEELFLAVLYMITDAVKCRRSRVTRVKWLITCFTTAEQMADIKACFRWYWSYLETDRAKLKRQRADLRAQIKQLEERIEISRKAERELISLMIAKYNIVPQRLVDEWASRAAEAPAVTEAKPVTKEQAKKNEDSWAAWNAAADVASNGEAWEKPAGSIQGNAPFQLEN